MRLLVGLFRLIAFFMCRKFLVCHLGFLLWSFFGRQSCLERLPLALITHPRFRAVFTGYVVVAYNVVCVNVVLCHKHFYKLDRTIHSLCSDNKLTVHLVATHFHAQRISVHTDTMQRMVRAFKRSAAVPRTVRIADALHNTVLVHKIVRRRLYAVIMEILCIIHCSVTVVRRVMHHNVFNAVSASA